MQRCPCCKARLSSGDTRCPRCAADLSQVVLCGQLARQWLSASVQFLSDREPEFAIHALKRSLAYQYTPTALIFRDFLLQKQYQDVFDLLAQEKWQPARQRLSLLCGLQSDDQGFRKLQGFIDFVALKNRESRSNIAQ